MPDAPAPKPPRSRWTFGLASLLAVMLICAILSALLGGLLRNPAGDQYWYVLASVGAPLALMIVVSLVLQFRRPGKRKARPPENHDPFQTP